MFSIMFDKCRQICTDMRRPPPSSEPPPRSDWLLRESVRSTLEWPIRDNFLIWFFECQGGHASLIMDAQIWCMGHPPYLLVFVAIWPRGGDCVFFLSNELYQNTVRYFLLTKHCTWMGKIEKHFTNISTGFFPNHVGKCSKIFHNFTILNFTIALLKIYFTFLNKLIWG